MTRHARTERLQLCDTLDRLGPDAPTLCEGWATRDLAAHLVVREHRPDLQAGAYVPFLADRLDREQRAIAAGDYTDLVARVRAGAPVWNPMHLAAVDELTNTVEYVVHHEDVRRAQADWTPRELTPDLEAALWAALRRTARLMFRKAPTGIVLVAPGRGRHAAKLPDAHGTVVLRGAPLELVLFAYGRQDVAGVEASGDADDIAALQGAHLGIS
ncbi:TIGR03085 family metal-binding protein [Intrasporangium sp. YIM S08009]|uniref:TIGR03085 family metal-binding protein n=1 Tax=Intrasporangium zincisolvens TaxID=3080018 RepID=UPI002B05A571|nr:TIGR03085 family metal-binding protein [Intrasporangium sp. YIM S08009]